MAKVDGELAPGTKKDDGRPPLDLVDPYFIEGIALALQFGAVKYEPWNHLGGFESSRIYASIHRHLGAWFKGEEIDPDSGELQVPHLFAAGAQLMFLCHQMQSPYSYRYDHLDDRPNFAECEVKEEGDRWSK